MTVLITIHVLSAIIGIGPVYFYPILFRKGQAQEELAHSVKLAAKLDLFPKVGGTIAALSGIVLVLTGNYGTILQLWLAGSLGIYIVIQIIVIGMIAPRVKALDRALSEPSPDFDYERSRREIQHRFIYCCLLGVLLFLFMILKPSGV